MPKSRPKDHKPTQRSLVDGVRRVAKWNDLADLWPHQRDGIRLCKKYLRNFSDKDSDAALLRMPTGTGKTGVMAVLSNYLVAKSYVLIVAPSSYLTFQLCKALNKTFWLAIHAQPIRGPKRAVSFIPRSLTRELKNLLEPAVVVCTTTTLQMLDAEFLKPSHSEEREAWALAYERLLSLIGAVVVDEGHREPAKEWARAVRRFQRPTVLFSATPYRNDLRFFNVGLDRTHRYVFGFHEATASPRPIIRDVDFVPASQSYTHSPEQDERDVTGLRRAASRFARLLTREFFPNKLLRNLPPDVETPRVIVRCETGAAVKEVKDAIEKELARVKSLKQARALVLAVHDRFEKQGRPNEYEHVPRRETLGDRYPERAVYWVHQFKLTEGLDDKDFCAVAFFQRFRNSRGLVQQIGRILRNPSYSAVPALVFHDPDDDMKDEFDGYRSFEKSENSIVGPEEIIDSIAKSLPDWFYFGGRYREALTYDREGKRQRTSEVMSGLQIRKSALVFRASRAPDAADLGARLKEYTENLEEQDHVRMVPWDVQRRGEGVIAVALHCRLEQTPYLNDRAFFAISLSPTVFFWHNGLLFLQGRTSCLPKKITDDIESIEPDALETLLPAENTRVTQMSLMNCDLGRNSVRRRAIAAYSLGDVASGLSDHFHFATAAVGAVRRENREFRRYLGFRSARVTEPEVRRSSLDEFCKWAEELALELNGPATARHVVLNRFAHYVRPHADEKARHILIEFDEFFRVYQHSGLFRGTFSSLAADVEPNEKSFSCLVAGRIISGKVEYRRDRHKFYLVSDDLDRIDPRSDQERTKPTTFLNQKSSFRIVTEDGKLYSNGRFYFPRQPVWEGGRLNDLAFFHHLECLANITRGEKGRGRHVSRRADGSLTWEHGSVFHVIDNDEMLFKAADFQPDVLVCEDLGTEMCDFLALDLRRNRNRMCVIHAKAYGGKEQFSAGAGPFHEAYAQVVKNLEFLNPLHSVAPDRMQRWDGNWKGVPRIRRKGRGLLSGAKIAPRVDQLVRSVETQKEVWVVLGNGFPIKDLLVDVKPGQLPEYHSVQLIYLLQSCSNQVSSVGARLRVFSVNHRPDSGKPGHSR